MMMIHGGDTVGYLRQHGREPLDFSANISPLGLPEGVRQAVVESMIHFDRYPDPLCRALREAIGLAEQMSSEHIVCGNGASELLFRLALVLRPRRAIVPAPSFSEYEAALGLAGCDVIRHTLRRDEGFHVTDRLLEHVTPGVEAVFLCQPNNPTGLTCPQELTLSLLNRCEAVGSRLIVDECFVDFLDNPKHATLRPWLEGHPSLVILKAFTKQYAMAGLRLGYLMASDIALIQKLVTCGPPWSVSVPAQAAGIAALREKTYLKRLRKLITTQRVFLKNELRGLGLTVADSEANFLFFSTTCPEFAERLKEKGILIRDCSNYAGLQPGDCRVAVRGREENHLLVKAMREIL